MSGHAPDAMDRAELDALLELATGAARDAGALLLERYGKLKGVRTKSSARDLVSEADVASERLLVARLREARPEHLIEAEEEVRDVIDPRVPRWFLDPLDGTTNYIHQLPIFAVSMGLHLGAAPQLAVVHLPLLNETFTATLGGGAHLNGEAIHVSPAGSLGEAVLATGFPYRRNELEHNNLANFGRFFLDVRGMRRMGAAAVDLAYTAAGRLDGYWELHLAPHDVAAGALLVREAGGRVTDADGGEDWLRGGHLVAAGPGLIEGIRARIQH